MSLKLSDTRVYEPHIRYTLSRYRSYSSTSYALGSQSPTCSLSLHRKECINRIKNKIREIRTIRTIRTIRGIRTIRTIREIRTIYYTLGCRDVLRGLMDVL